MGDNLKLLDFILETFLLEIIEFFHTKKCYKLPHFFFEKIRICSSKHQFSSERLLDSVKGPVFFRWTKTEEKYPIASTHGFAIAVFPSIHLFGCCDGTTFAKIRQWQSEATSYFMMVLHS